MSTCHWVNVEGIGIKVNELSGFCDREKLIEACIKVNEDEGEIAVLRELLTNDMPIHEIVDSYEDLCGLLCVLDDTGSLTYGDNNDGDYYLYYQPKYPWYMGPNEPKSLKEVHQRLIGVVKQITTLSDTEIEELIDDDLYEYGCG